MGTAKKSNARAKFSKAKQRQSNVRYGTAGAWRSGAKQSKGEAEMVCEECTRYRGMKDGLVRCWDSQLMMLTCIPIPSLSRKKECPKWTKKRSSKT